MFTDQVFKRQIVLEHVMEHVEQSKTIFNKTPAKAFTPPAEKKKGHKVIFRQKRKRVTGLYNT